MMKNHENGLLALFLIRFEVIIMPNKVAWEVLESV